MTPLVYGNPNFKAPLLGGAAIGLRLLICRFPIDGKFRKRAGKKRDSRCPLRIRRRGLEFDASLSVSLDLSHPNPRSGM